jgi:hypothetical protein
VFSIGFLHEDKAAAIGRLMAVDGQRDPIKVVAQPAGSSKPWRRVVGRHRLHGARLEGIKVWAIEVAGKPEDLADLEASKTCIVAHWRRSSGRSLPLRWSSLRRSASLVKTVALSNTRLP